MLIIYVIILLKLLKMHRHKFYVNINIKINQNDNEKIKKNNDFCYINNYKGFANYKIIIFSDLDYINCIDIIKKKLILLKLSQYTIDYFVRKTTNKFNNKNIHLLNDNFLLDDLNNLSPDSYDNLSHDSYENLSPDNFNNLSSNNSSPFMPGINQSEITT